MAGSMNAASPMTVWYLRPTRSEYERGYWLCDSSGKTRHAGPFTTERAAEAAMRACGITKEC